MAKRKKKQWWCLRNSFRGLLTGDSGRQRIMSTSHRKLNISVMSSSLASCLESMFWKELDAALVYREWAYVNLKLNLVKVCMETEQHEVNPNC